MSENAELINIFFYLLQYKSVSTASNFIKKEKWWGELDEPLTGFSWAPGSKSDTKGILIWSDVFLHEQNNEEIAIILIDTQGLYELQRQSNEDAKIFGITSLISSIQILNLQGVIHENELEYLKLVTDFTKVAVMRQKENSVNAVSKPFQNLLFLVRDWFDDEVGFGYKGGEKYLKTVLNAKEQSDESVEEVRSNIKNSFEQLNAFLMPHPSKNAVSSTYNGRWSQLDGDFKENLKNLITSLLSPENLTVKKFFDKEMTANDLMEHAVLLFKSFESSELPNIGNLFNVVVGREMKVLTDKLFKEYKQNLVKRIKNMHFNKKDSLSFIDEDHILLQSKMLLDFKNAPKMCDKKMEKECETSLKIDSDEYFKEWMPFIEVQINMEQEIDKATRERMIMEKDEELEKRKGLLYALCKVITLGFLDCV